jgi:hypothetical protein
VVERHELPAVSALEESVAMSADGVVTALQSALAVEIVHAITACSEQTARDAVLTGDLGSRTPAVPAGRLNDPMPLLGRARVEAVGDVCPTVSRIDLDRARGDDLGSVALEVKEKAVVRAFRDFERRPPKSYETSVEANGPDVVDAHRLSAITPVAR